jgi:hypothetical protein
MNIALPKWSIATVGAAVVFLRRCGVADRDGDPAPGMRRSTCERPGNPRRPRRVWRKVVVDGERIRLIKPVGKALPADLIDAAREHQDELRALAGKVEPLPPVIVWSREDSQAFDDKVTGTLLFEGLSKPKADAFAFEFHRMAKSHIRAVTTWALRPLRSRRV